MTVNLTEKSGWKFALFETAQDTALYRFDADESAFCDVELPHDWAITTKRNPERRRSQGFFDRSGDGWYRFRFDAPEGYTPDKSVWIYFEAVQNFSTVWLNEEEIGGHADGHIPFTCRVNQLREKDNLLVVRADVSGEKNSDRWYAGSGIYRDVRLIVKDAVHMLPDGADLAYKLNQTLDTAALTLRLRLGNATGCSRTASARLSLTAPDGKIRQFTETLTVPSGESELSANFELDNVKLWDIDTPNRYLASVSLVCEEMQTADETEFYCGFRESHFEQETGYWLNGRNLKIHGVCVHTDCGVFGVCNNPKLWRRRLTSLKAMGCNTVRSGHDPNSREFLSLCDELGLLAVDELYDKWKGMYYGKFFERDRFSDLAALVHRDFNHPSIILWSLGNELDIQFREEFYTFTKEMVDECHRLDASRPASLALIGYCRGEDLSDPVVLNDVLEKTVRYSKIVDVNMMNYMEPFFEPLRAKGLEKCILATEVFAHYTYYNTVENSFAFRPGSVFAQLDELPYAAGGLIWTGVDYLGGGLDWPAWGMPVGDVYASGTRKLGSWHQQGQWTSADDAPFVRIGIFDESMPFDMARDRWGGLPMAESWSCPPERLCSSRHVAVMTNCEEVELFITKESAGNAPLDEAALRQEVDLGMIRSTGKLPRDPSDRMAHFWVSAARGPLTAIGYHNGKTAARQTLYFADAAEKLALIPDAEPMKPDGRDVTFVEIELQDAFGQVWQMPYNGTWKPEITVEVSGAADFYALDSGDYTMEDTDMFSPAGRLFRGRTTLVLRSNGKRGEITVTVRCGTLSETITMMTE